MFQQKKETAQILRDCKMSSRSEYYLGRGETTSDLNSSILENIHEMLTKEHGIPAGAAFTNMVCGLSVVCEDMSASTFINTLYNLESVGWKYQPGILPSDFAASVAQTVSDEMKHTDGHADASLSGLMMIMGRGNDTAKHSYGRRDIAGNFLLAHKAEITDKPLLERVNKMRFSAYND